MSLRRCLALAVSALLPSLAVGAGDPATQGVVASVHPLATDAGIAVLQSGGNAVDAALAVALTLGVADGHNSGIGGGCFMLIRLADGRIVALDGRETAPAAATRDMYLRDGKADTHLSQTGSLAIGVPGSLAVYAEAAEKFGRRPLSAALLSAARVAEAGFPIDALYASRLAETAPALEKFESSRAVFFDSNGKPPAAGDRLGQPDLARSYRAIAEEGIGWFYGGSFAEKLERWMKEHGGILTREDFSRYALAKRGPVRTTYRGREIVSFPPPSSGGVHVIQILNILENFDLAAMQPAVRAHTVAEAMKLAFADRAHWLGDPDFAPVPRGLVGKPYAAELAARIQPDGTLHVPSHGDPPEAAADTFGGHTTHFSVADTEGNWVACTATINTSFGSKVIIPGTGILLNNQMDDFSVQPGVPNAFGLVGAEANAIAPRKRPLSSMSPTFVMKDGAPILALGAAGGPKIITQTVLNLIGILDLDMDLPAALAQPRIHHQWRPDTLFVEPSLPGDVRDGLAARGHTIGIMESAGVSVAIGRDAEGFFGAVDPRVEGKAAAF